MNMPVMLALLALVSGGLVSFNWQISTSNGVYSPSFLFIQSIAFCIGSVGIHLVQGKTFALAPPMVGLAVATGCLGLTTVTALMYALRLGGSGSVVFPIGNLGMVVAVILAFVVFREPITTTKLLGLGFAATAVILLSR